MIVMGEEENRVGLVTFNCEVFFLVQTKSSGVFVMIIRIKGNQVAYDV